jgi:hypothetical protein
LVDEQIEVPERPPSEDVLERLSSGTTQHHRRPATAVAIRRRVLVEGGGQLGPVATRSLLDDASCVDGGALEPSLPQKGSPGCHQLAPGSSSVGGHQVVGAGR